MMTDRMRTFGGRAIAAGLGVMVVGLTVAAAPARVCLQGVLIQSTEVKDDSTILFRMRDGRNYVNHLPQPCPGLKASNNGFTYEPSDPADDELCDNLGTFRVNEPVVGGGAVCLFGPFTRVAGGR